MQANFQFDYPLLDTRMKPLVNFTNLTVFANAEVGRLNQVVEVKIKRITYFKKEEKIGVDIAGLLQVVNPAIFKEISDAAENHATTIFEEKTLQC